MRFGRRSLGFGRGWVGRIGGRILKGGGGGEESEKEGRIIGKRVVCMDEEMKSKETNEKLAFFRVFSLVPEGSEERFDRHVCVMLWMLDILDIFFLRRQCERGCTN